MFITVANMFKKTVNGHIFRGKNRLVKQVSRRAMDTLEREYALQERNMMLLLKPFLSVEQSSGHARALNKTAEKLKSWNDQQAKSKLKPHVRIEDRISHLSVKETWE